MMFTVVDEVLRRQMEGDGRSPAAEQLDLRLLRFGRGVAMYDMPVRPHVCDPSGAVASGVLTMLAEAAMTAAATTTTPDDQDAPPLVLEMGVRFDRAVDVREAASVRAEAVVMRTDARSVRVEAELHCDGARVATCEATYTRVGHRGPARVGSDHRGREHALARA